MTDYALVRDGVVAQVARDAPNSEPFGPEPQGLVVEATEETGRPAPEMVWDGHTFQPPAIEPPAPERRRVRKADVFARARDFGLMPAVYTIMYADTPEARDALTRWNMPGHTSVFHDDPDTIAVLTLAGASPDQVEAIMAEGS